MSENNEKDSETAWFSMLEEQHGLRLKWFVCLDPATFSTIVGLSSCPRMEPKLGLEVETNCFDLFFFWM